MGSVHAAATDATRSKEVLDASDHGPAAAVEQRRIVDLIGALDAHIVAP